MGLNQRRILFEDHIPPVSHFDHGYAVTSYASQGQTVDRVIINADTKESAVLLNQRMIYVALSRARDEALIYTNSRDELGAALDREADKQVALEAVQQRTLVPPQAQHQRESVHEERSRHTREVYHD